MDNKIRDPKDIKLKKKSKGEINDMAAMLGLVNPREKQKRAKMMLVGQGLIDPTDN